MSRKVVLCVIQRCGIVLLYCPRVPQIDQPFTSVDLQQKCCPAMRHCYTVLSTHVANHPMLRISRLATRVLTCPPTNRIGWRFVWTDAIDWCDKTLPRTCASAHSHMPSRTHVRTHVHTNALWNLLDLDKWLRSALRALRAPTFCTLANCSGRHEASADGTRLCRVILLLYRAHVSQIDRHLASVNRRHVF